MIMAGGVVDTVWVRRATAGARRAVAGEEAGHEPGVVLHPYPAEVTAVAVMVAVAARITSGAVHRPCRVGERLRLTGYISG
jgi:hypothetical protein